VESDGSGWLIKILKDIYTGIELPNIWILELRHVFDGLSNAVGVDNVAALCVPVLMPIEVLTSDSKQNLIEIVTEFYVMFKACSDWAYINAQLTLFSQKCYEVFDTFMEWKAAYSKRLWESELSIAIAWSRSAKGDYMVPMFGDKSLNSWLKTFTPAYLGAIMLVCN
jgi:hypothetical protein